MEIFAHSALLDQGWKQSVRVEVENGLIVEVTPDSQPKLDDVCVDTLLPGMPNLHSHTFQRAMAGLSEFSTSGHESFWTWRKLMYQFLDHLTPEHIYAIAGMAFVEMQEAGYTSVGEFHYLHNQIGGQKYDDPSELSRRIFAAATQSGIGLTHLPVLYCQGGLDERPLVGGQLRFANSVEQFMELIHRCKVLADASSPDFTVGIAPHSLRAVSAADLQTVIENTPDGPIHMHVSEQVAEVEDVQNVLGARPIEWLLSTTGVNARWCLIHATHMTNEETQSLAKTGAVVGLCPVTEANLGDGIFNGRVFLEANGRFGIGTDSNINISLTDELRLLEYSQRLKHQSRNVMLPHNDSTGAFLYKTASINGAQAIGRNTGTLAVGKLADMVALNSQDVKLCALQQDQLLDGFVFAGNDRVVTDVWSAGRHMVQDRQHKKRDEIERQFRKTMSDLVQRIGR